MSDKDQLKALKDVEVEAIREDELEEAAGGIHHNSTDSCCTCSGFQCSGTSDRIASA